MYKDYYRFSSLPFQLGPDPRFFFGSTGHEKAMAYLTYGLTQGEGFIVITGDVGAGKSTVVARLLEGLDASLFVSAKLVVTQFDAEDTLKMVAGAFGIPSEGVAKATVVQRLEAFLQNIHSSGRRTLLVVDEVQNISIRALEELRMLSNFQIGSQTLLQSFLVGQPQFRPIISSPDLEQLRQRIIASYHLGPLTAEETEGYVRHRLGLVGWMNDPEFAPGAMAMIHQRTGGVPRKINTLCSRLLLFGYLENTHVIEPANVIAVAEELSQELFLTGPNGAIVQPAGDASSKPGLALSREVDATLRNHDARLETLEILSQSHDRKLQHAQSFAAHVLERLTP